MKTLPIKTLFFTLFSLSLIANPSIGHCAPTPTTSAPEKDAPALKDSEVAATIGDSKILVKDIDQQLKRPEMAVFYVSASKNNKTLNQLRKGALNSIINRDLLLKAASSSTLVKVEEIKAESDKIISQQGGKSAIEEKLKSKGLSFDNYFKEMNENLRIKAYIEKDLGKEVVVSDADVKKIFDQKADQFALPERVKASHILVAVVKDAPKEKIDEAQKKIDKIYKDATATGADFGKIAEASSDDPGSKKQGGDLGTFPKGAMVPEFENVAFALKPGEISKPFQTQFGFHILKVTDHLPPQPAKFEEYKDEIQKNLLMQERSKLVQTKLEQMKKELNVSVKIDALKVQPTEGQG